MKQRLGSEGYDFDPRSYQLRCEAVARSFTAFVFVHRAIRLGH